jgi:iron complex transport system substrate-binding protein
MRICSLLPSSTEMLFALGLEDQVVGVTHECDFPPQALAKPQVTSAEISQALASVEIDLRVRQQIENAGSLYELNVGHLEELKPDIIFTQQLCTVCAVSYENVYRVAATLSSKPVVVNLEPTSVEGIFDTILEVGRLTGVSDRALRLVDGLLKRVERVRRLTKHADRRKLLFLEWLNPPFCAGHWIPELIDYAGGFDPFARKLQPSVQLAWEQILLYNPDVIVVSCCGFSVDRTLKEVHFLDKIRKLPSVREKNVYVVDGSSYFSRPGPRVVESLEILATILHPEIFPIDYHQSVIQRINMSETVYSS